MDTWEKWHSRGGGVERRCVFSGETIPFADFLKIGESSAETVLRCRECFTMNGVIERELWLCFRILMKGGVFGVSRHTAPSRCAWTDRQYVLPLEKSLFGGSMVSPALTADARIHLHTSCPSKTLGRDAGLPRPLPPAVHGPMPTHRCSMGKCRTAVRF